jgi:hypothetical protein
MQEVPWRHAAAQDLLLDGRRGAQGSSNRDGPGIKALASSIEFLLKLCDAPLLSSCAPREQAALAAVTKALKQCLDWARLMPGQSLLQGMVDGLSAVGGVVKQSAGQIDAGPLPSSSSSLLVCAWR